MPLIQLDPTRKLVRAVPVTPTPFESSDEGWLEAAYQRVQYRVSTTKSNHAHASDADKREKYQLVMRVFAVVADSEKVEVGRWESEPLTVRGRSPKNWPGQGTVVRRRKPSTSQTPLRAPSARKVKITVKVEEDSTDGDAEGDSDSELAQPVASSSRQVGRAERREDKENAGLGHVDGLAPFILGPGGRTRSRIKFEDADEL